MINLILNTIITLGLIFSAFNYAPLATLESVKNPPRIYGATITTIAGSDTLSSSRTTINDNFSALNDGKIENSTTSVAAITTLSNLVSIGTITTGTWSADAIGVSKGGTGTTTISTYQVLLGDGANGVTVASSTGTTGQFLTSNGAGSYPSWQSSTVNQTDSYNFTGTTFRVKNLHASSTSANPIVLNGVSLSTPSTQGASSTSLRNDGSGALTWQFAGWDLLARQSYGAVATATIAFPVRGILGVIIRSTGDSSDGNGHTLAFNTGVDSPLDTYGFGSTLDGVAGLKASTTLSANGSVIFGSGTTSPFLITGTITNATSTKKTFTYTGTYESGNFPYTIEGSYIWATTTKQINTINLAGYRWGDAPANWTSGMVIEVYGNNAQ